MYDWTSEADAERFVRTYADLILRLCLSHGLSRADAQDVCQELFVKPLTTRRRFSGAEHEKAWVIRAAGNAVKTCCARRRAAAACHSTKLPIPPLLKRRTARCWTRCALCRRAAATRSLSAVGRATPPRKPPDCSAFRPLPFASGWSARGNCSKPT